MCVSGRVVGFAVGVSAAGFPTRCGIGLTSLRLLGFSLAGRGCELRPEAGRAAKNR